MNSSLSGTSGSIVIVSGRVLVVACSNIAKFEIFQKQISTISLIDEEGLISLIKTFIEELRNKGDSRFYLGSSILYAYIPEPF